MNGGICERSFGHAGIVYVSLERIDLEVVGNSGPCAEKMCEWRGWIKIDPHRPIRGVAEYPWSECLRLEVREFGACENVEQWPERGSIEGNNGKAVRGSGPLEPDGCFVSWTVRVAERFSAFAGGAIQGDD